MDNCIRLAAEILVQTGRGTLKPERRAVSALVLALALAEALAQRGEKKLSLQ
jgi:hypothetical protein